MAGRAWLFAALLVACGDDGASSRCVAGETRTCDRADGRAGVQVCGLDFRWSSGCGELPDGGVLGPDVPWLGDGVPPIAPPSLTPCPDGWREVPPAGEVGPATCDPYPEGGALDCPDGQAHFPGDPGCTPVGSACPTGEFSESLPSDRRVVYVRPGATLGDGSEAQPYGSLSEFALGGLPMGTVIALSRGVHEGPVRLARAHEVAGACAEQTLLSASVRAETEGVITFVGEGGVATDLSLTDSPRPGVWLSGPGIAGRLRGVDVARTEHLGVSAGARAQLTMETVVIRETAGRASDDAFGRGFTVEVGATADVRRALVSGTRDVAILVNERSSLQMRDVVVHDTASRSNDGLFGRGLSVQGGATADVGRALFSNGHDVGVLVSDEGAALTASDVIVRNTGGRASEDRAGRGVVVQLDATASLDRVLLQRNREIGMMVRDAATTLRLNDAVVRENLSQASDGRFGRALNAEAGATVELARTLFADNREIGLHAAGLNTGLSLLDVVIRDTDGRMSDGRFGRGIGVQAGATVTATRVRVSRSRDLGLFVAGVGALLESDDLLVDETLGRASDGGSGFGITVQEDATARVSRAVLRENRGYGAVGLLAVDFALENVVIAGTELMACSETTCPGEGRGHGVGSYYRDTSVRMTRFSVQDSALCGVHVAREAAGLDLESGEVRGSAIGACIQVDGFDQTRLTTLVRYLDNDVNLDSTSLPVPEVAEVAIVAEPWPIPAM